MIERDCKEAEEALSELRKDPGRWLWDDHDGPPAIVRAASFMEYRKVPIPFKYAMQLLAQAGRDSPSNKCVYLVAPLADGTINSSSAAAVSVYDNLGWMHSFSY